MIGAGLVFVCLSLYSRKAVPSELVFFMVSTARGFWNSLTFLFLANVKFPWPTELTLSHVRPDDGLKTPLKVILSIYLFMLSARHEQCTSEFLVAFGSTGCRDSFRWRTRTVRVAGANVECQSKKLLRGVRAHAPSGNFINWTESIFWSRVEGRGSRFHVEGDISRSRVECNSFFPNFLLMEKIKNENVMWDIEYRKK